MDPALRQHLIASFGISAGEAERIVAEVVGHYAQTLDAFVRERHAALKRRGFRNEAIYATIIAEVRSRRFPAEALTERQIRRLIYG